MRAFGRRFPAFRTCEDVERLADFGFGGFIDLPLPTLAGVAGQAVGAVEPAKLGRNPDVVAGRNRVRIVEAAGRHVHLVGGIHVAEGEGCPAGRAKRALGLGRRPVDRGRALG